MSYIIDDDENRIQEIKEKIDELEVQTFSSQVVGRNESTRNTGIESGDGAATEPYPLWMPIRDFGTLGSLTLEILLNRVDGHVAKLTANGDIDFAFSIPPGVTKKMSFDLDVTIDAIGGYVFNLPGNVEPLGTVIDNAANARTIIRFQTTDGGVIYQAENLTVPVVGGGYNTIQDEGVPLPQRTTINFTGPGVVASDVGGLTQVTISAGGGGEFFGPWTANHDAGNFALNNLSALQISDSVGSVHGLLQGLAALGVRLTLTTGEVFQIFDNITNIFQVDNSGINIFGRNIGMGTGGNIIGGGVGEGMTNVGHFDFVDNLATPTAAVSIYSDGTNLIANTGGGAGNVVITPVVENLVMGSFDITSSAGNGMTSIGHLDFIDNLATPIAPVSIYSDGVDLFGNTGGIVVNFTNAFTGVFLDNTFRIQGSVDQTKQLAFEVDGVTTATTRTITIPDANTVLVLDNLSNLNAITAVNVTLQPGNDGLTNLGSFSFNWDEIFARTLIFKEDKPVDATETAIGANASELWLNQTNAGNLIAFRWDNVVGYEFGRTIFKTQSPVLSWQLVNGATNTFSITDFATHMEFLNSNYDVFRFEGANHTRLDLTGIGFTTAGLNSDEILFDSSNATANNIVGQVHFVGHTDTAANFDIAKIVAINQVPTNVSRSGLLEFRISQSGTENILMFDIDGFNNLLNARTTLDMNNNKIADIGETTITDLTTAVGASGDLLMMVDITDGLMKKVDAIDFLIGGTTLSGLTIDVTKNWAAFGITNLGQLDMVGDIVMANNNVTGLNAIAFTDAAGQIAGSSVTPHMNFVLTGASTFRFTTNAENILDITSAGLTMLGTNNIILGNNNITGVNSLQFTTSGQIITDGVNALTLAVGTGDTIDLSVNSGVQMSVGDGFVDLFNQFVDIDNLATPADPAAGTRRLFVDSVTGEVSVRTSTGITVSLEAGGGGGNSISQGDSNLTIVDAGTGTWTWTTDGIIQMTSTVSLGFEFLNDIDMNLQKIFFNNADSSIGFDATDNGVTIFNQLTDQFNLRWQGALEYDFNQTEFDLHSNDIRMGGTTNRIYWNIGSAGTETRIVGTTSNLRIATGSVGDEIVFTQVSTDLVEINSIETRFINSDIEMDLNQDIRWSATVGGSPRIGVVGGDMTLEVGATNDILFDYGTDVQMKFIPDGQTGSGNAFIVIAKQTNTLLSVFEAQQDRVSGGTSGKFAVFQGTGKNSSGVLTVFGAVEYFVDLNTAGFEDAEVGLPILASGGFVDAFTADGVPSSSSTIPRIGFRGASPKAVEFWTLSGAGTPDRTLSTTSSLSEVAQSLVTLLEDLQAMGVVG